MREAMLVLYRNMPLVDLTGSIYVLLDGEGRQLGVRPQNVEEVE